MNILITGGTGLIGSALVKTLSTPHTHITVLTRSATKAASNLPKNVAFLTALSSLKNLNKFDAVINLAGEPIFAKRWTAAQKHRLRHSRLALTAKIVELINQSERPPYFISASATGIYGNRPDEILTETAPIAPQSFSAKLCQDWEQTASQSNAPMAIIRTGMVLSPQGGALHKMLPIYQWGLGGKLGSGTQYWSWIALEDMVAALQFLLEHQSQGIFNLTAPNPITNREFSQQLAQKLHRPNIVITPTFLLKQILGERAEIVLDSQYVMPQNLLSQGFHFRYPDFKTYLANTDLD